jgi:hypothetical protein
MSRARLVRMGMMREHSLWFALRYGVHSAETGGGDAVAEEQRLVGLCDFGVDPAPAATGS